MTVNKQRILHDKKAVAAAKKDRKAFAVLYNKYYEQIFLFLFKKLQNEELTADICQKTFIKAMVSIEKYQDQGHPFSAWLYRIASNEANMYFRSLKKMHVVYIADHQLTNIITQAEEPETEENKNKLVEILNNLPPEHTELIEFRFFEKLSFKKIAEIYQTTEPNIKMKIYRIIEKIKKSIPQKI